MYSTLRYIKGNKPHTKYHVSYDFIYIKCPEYGNP
jgi:hypothetical protein